MPSPVSIPIVLIGYGSIGKRMARILQPFVRQFFIADINAANRKQAAQTYPQAIVVDGLNALIQKNIDWEKTLAVISTWGPSHAALFHKLADLGTKHIICEKPLASSINLAAGIVERASRENIALGIPHHFRFSNFAKSLSQLAEEHCLGIPQQIVLHGGAICLVTTGIHFIDLACELFQSFPISVTSTAMGQPINPRSPDLHYYGGTAAWSFEGGREAAFVLNNVSSLYWTLHIYFSHAVAEVDFDLNIVIKRRENSADISSPLTRAGSAKQIIYQGPMPGIRPWEERIVALANEIISGEVRTFKPAQAALAVNSCIGALASGRDGVRIDLPIDPASKLGREEWPIS